MYIHCNHDCLDHLLLHVPCPIANTPAEICTDLQGGMGSLRAVSVQDCQVACEMAQLACTSFAYNAVMAACFLKRGGGRATCISPTSICTEQVLPGVCACRLPSLRGLMHTQMHPLHSRPHALHEGAVEQAH